MGSLSKENELLRIKVTVRVRTIIMELNRNDKTVEWFAQRLSTTAAYINHILDGRKNPSPELREKMRKVLGSINRRQIKWDDLFKMDESGA